MSMVSFITVAAGILAAIGLGGVLLSAATKDFDRRDQRFQVGKTALCLGGLVLLIGSIAGWAGADAMFCGLIMVVFGADAKLLPASKPGPATPHEPAQ